MYVRLSKAKISSKVSIVLYASYYNRVSIVS